MKDFFIFVLELIKITAISLIIIIPVRYFLIQPFYVKGESMEPSFYNHEYLIVDEISYNFKDPKRGDIIVFRYPRNPQEFFIKRLIALPGEEVQVKNGYVYIFNNSNPDGFVLDEPYLGEDVRTYAMTEDKVILGDNEYFVLGDNRGKSKDSRSFGPVNESFVIGKVFFRGFPFNRIDFFKTQEYKY